MARDTEPQLVAGSGDTLIDNPSRIAKRAGKGVFRDNSSPDLIGDKDHRRALPGQFLCQGLSGGLPILFGQHQIGQPERQTIHQPRVCAIAVAQRADQIHRGLDRPPVAVAPRLMLGDPVGHFPVMGLGRGDIDRRPSQRQRHLLCQGAFARTCAAGYEDRLSHGDVTNHVPFFLKSPEMTLPDASELLLIRHAPAMHGGRLCGRTDVPCDLGDPQVWQPLQRLVAQVPHRIVSPALRCRQTAAALWSDAWPGMDPAQDARLWEQDFGTQEGMPFAEIPDLGPLSQADLAQHRPPGGESFADMVARISPALMDHAARAHQDGPVAVVAHAGTVRSGLALALGAVPPALAFEIAPWSVTRLRVYDKGASGLGLSVIAVNWRPL